jgi:hypothetical protein
MGVERSSPGGGNSRTVSSVHVALNRLYCLVISSSIVNLGGVISSSLSLIDDDDKLRFIITVCKDNSYTTTTTTVSKNYDYETQEYKKITDYGM